MEVKIKEAATERLTETNIQEVAEKLQCRKTAGGMMCHSTAYRPTRCAGTQIPQSWERRGRNARAPHPSRGAPF